MWWQLGLALLSIFVVLFVLGRRNERAVARDWELLLTPKGERAYRRVEGRVQAELALADIAFDEAFEVRELGSVDEAMRLLDVGYRVIEHFAPSMLRLLGAMATFSRMVSAMAPVPPLRPRNFRLAQLASLAWLDQFLHQFLVSTQERFRLRIYVLARGFGVASAFLVRSIQGIVRRRSQEEKDWEQVQAIRGDIQTLTEESLESLKALLVSLHADRRDAGLLDDIR